MLFALERDIRYREPLPPRRRRHHLGLIGRNDLVFESLEQDERRRQLVGEVDWRSRTVCLTRRRIWTDERVEIARLKLVSVLGEHFDVADAVVAGTCPERVVKRQRRQRRV